MKRAGMNIVVRRVAAALLLSTAPFVAVERAIAACDQTAPINNATVTCSGATANQNPPNGWGTGVETGNTIHILSGASVSGTSNGLAFSDGSVINDGGDIFTFVGGAAGIAAGGTVTVTNNSNSTFGRITGSLFGIDATNVNVANNGQITSGPESTSAYTAIHATGTATVSNTGDDIKTGIISGIAFGISTGTVNVTANTGLIEATDTFGVAIDATNSTGTNSVTSSGTIQANGTSGRAIRATGDLTVTSSGTVQANGDNGIAIEGGRPAATNVINTGTIQANGTGSLAIEGGDDGTTTVTNSGKILAIGTRGEAIFSNGVVSVSNTGDGTTTGIISGDRHGIDATTVTVTGSSGLIEAKGAGGIVSAAIEAVDATVIGNTGTIRANGTGTSVAIDASNVTVIGNSGTIEATGAGNTAIFAGSGGTAKVDNLTGGTITGGRLGIHGTTVNVTGNAGIIEATGLGGAAIDALGDATVQSNSGTIRANADPDANGVSSVAIKAGGTATITANSGTIEANGVSGIAIKAGIVDVQANTRTIQATGAGGIAIQGGTSATVVNSAPGTITGNAFAITAPTVTVTGNSGTIEATADAVGAGGHAINGNVVTVTNSGTIRENGNDGRAINANSGAATAAVNNLVGGFIIADGANGIAIDAGNSATVTNAGTIQAANGTAVGTEGLATIANLTGGKITGGISGVGAGAGVLDVTNALGATISGGTWGVIGSGSVKTAGIITGGTNSVLFTGTGANTLTLQTGAVLNGDASGSTNSTNNQLTLEGSGVTTSNFQNFNNLNVQATGTWVWNSTASGTFGQTTVESGTFAVDGLLFSPVNVNADAVLAGRGTIKGAVSLAQNGILAPGAAVPFSTLSVQGNVDFTNRGIDRVNVGAAGQNDKLLLTGGGAATLTNGTVSVLAQNGFALATPYTILTATGGLGGTTFNSQVMSNFPFLTPSLTYDANDVFLTLNANAGPGGGFGLTGAALTPNQRAVAGALDASPSSNSLVLAVLKQTIDSARRAFDALSGEIFGSVHDTQAAEADFARSGMLGRMRQMSYAGAPGELGALAFAGPQLAYASGDASAGFPVKAAPGPREPAPDLTFWAQGLGGWGHADSDGNAASLKSRFGGFLSGVDGRFADTWRVGLVAGYLRSDLKADARLSSAGIDSAQLGAYAGGRVGVFNVRGGASISFDSIDTSRSIIFPGFTDQTKASFHGNVGQVFGEVGYGLALDHIAVEPFAGLAYVHVHDNSFLESGGAAALAGASAHENIGYSTLGIRAATAIPLANGTVLVPRGSLQWQYAFGDVTPAAALAFQGTGAGFSVAGIPLARNTALVEGGFDWRFTPQAKLGAFYQGELAAHAQAHAVKGTFTWDF